MLLFPQRARPPSEVYPFCILHPDSPLGYTLEGEVHCYAAKREQDGEGEGEEDESRHEPRAIATDGIDD